MKRSITESKKGGEKDMIYSSFVSGVEGRSCRTIPTTCMARPEIPSLTFLRGHCLHPSRLHIYFDAILYDLVMLMDMNEMEIVLLSPPSSQEIEMKSVACAVILQISESTTARIFGREVDSDICRVRGSVNRGHLPFTTKDARLILAMIESR